MLTAAAGTARRKRAAAKQQHAAPRQSGAEAVPGSAARPSTARSDHGRSCTRRTACMPAAALRCCYGSAAQAQCSEAAEQHASRSRARRCRFALLLHPAERVACAPRPPRAPAARRRAGGAAQRRSSEPGLPPTEAWERCWARHTAAAGGRSRTAARSGPLDDDTAARRQPAPPPAPALLNIAVRGGSLCCGSLPLGKLAPGLAVSTATVMLVSRDAHERRAAPQREGGAAMLLRAVQRAAGPHRPEGQRCRSGPSAGLLGIRAASRSAARIGTTACVRSERASWCCCCSQL